MSNETKHGDDSANADDPWLKLSPEEKKRAERHLVILYVAMGLMVIAPFIVYFLIKT